MRETNKNIEARKRLEREKKKEENVKEPDNKNVIWKDCFGNELFVGDDIIIALTKSSNGTQMYSGIVTDITDDKFSVTYNDWVGNNEYEHDFTVKLTQTENVKTHSIRYVFKLNNYTK